MISIFAKRAFLNTNPHNEFVSKEKSYHGRGHLQRVSTMIREQVIDYIDGARLNPTEGYENDTCIYVKPHIKKDNMDFKFEGRKAYLDIIDGHNLGQLLEKYPDVGVIVCSEVDKKTMSSVVPNEIIVIPQHHCNFERKKRARLGVKTVGMIGTENAFDYVSQNLREQLQKRGIEFKTFSKFFSRQDIIDFYLSIDVQIVWRPYKKLLSNPLKLVNAASFGVPTIALDEEAFKEMDGCYLPVETEGEFLYYLGKLTYNQQFYDNYSQKCLAKAEEYHIENIAELYKELDE